MFDKMGYWILLAMMACALVAVVVAVSIERQGGVRRAARARSDALRWLAVVSEGQDGRGGAWATELTERLPESVEGDVLLAPGSTLTELTPAIAQAVDERDPDVVLLWTAFDDVLAGVPLVEHERALATVLEDLGDRDVTAVVGNVPDLARLPGAASAGLPAEELRLLTDRWNGTIARLAHHHGALVADLRDVLLASIRLTQTERINHATAVSPTPVADHFLPVLRQALVGARRRRDADVPAQPL